MSDTRFTKGPWVAIQSASRKRFRIAFEGQHEQLSIADVYGTFDKKDRGGDYEYNALLIAESPALFEALKDCLECLENGELYSFDAIRNAKAVIARVKGE